MIAIVIPTIRPESMKQFENLWRDLIAKHEVLLVRVNDGKNPTVQTAYTDMDYFHREFTIKDFKEIKDVFYNFNDGIRNLGFAVVAKYFPEVDYIISLDDDVAPYGDTIADHIKALEMKVPITWMSTASEFTRGFPYNKRDEAEVVLSHGVWEGVADWDAPTQLVIGNKPVDFYKGVVPRFVQFPLCAMNFAFKRKVLPYVYQAPMGPKVKLDRFADIWGGIEMKMDIDNKGWGAVTGYATVKHERASNVWANLIKEAKGLKMNENYGEDPYFKLFYEKRKKWKEFCMKYL